MSEKTWELVLNVLETLEKRISRLEALEEERQDIAKQVKDLLPTKDKDGLQNYRLTVRDLNKENKCPGGYKDCDCKGDKHPWTM